MGVFICLYFSLLLIWFVLNYLPKSQQRIFVCVSSLFVLWFIQAFRDKTIGTDLVNYLLMFQNSEAMDLTSTTEKGYTIFNSTIHHYISTNVTVFLGIVSLTILVPFTYIVYKFSKIPALSFIIYVSFVIFIFSFSALRQTIAIGLTTWSFYYVYKKNFIKFLLLAFLATTFHSTAIIFIITYPICNLLFIKKKYYVIASIAMIFIVYSLSSFLDFLLPLIFEEDKYASYYGSEQGAPAYNLLIIIFLFFISSFLIKKPDKILADMRAITFMAFCCQCLGLISSTAPRIGFYFFIFIPILLPNIIAELKTSYGNRLIIELGVASFMIFFFFYSYSSGYLNVIPYRFIWE